MSSSTSAKTTFAPSIAAQDAVATKVIGVVTTSSPGPTPRAAYAMCSAAVPDVQLTARCPPASSDTAFSNAVTAGPVVSQSPRSTAVTASMSASEID